MAKSVVLTIDGEKWEFVENFRNPEFPQQVITLEQIATNPKEHASALAAVVAQGKSTTCKKVEVKAKDKTEKPTE